MPSAASSGFSPSAWSWPCGPTTDANFGLIVPNFELDDEESGFGEEQDFDLRYARRDE